MERKGFIRSFVQKIMFDNNSAELEYTFPLLTKNKDRASNTEVLSLGQTGVGEGI